MKLTRQSALSDVAVAIADALRKGGISAVLTGGACATLYTNGAYASQDLDFIIRGGTTRRALDEAMARVGFRRDGDRYVHSEVPFFVEFPRGPLAIGDDLSIKPVELRVGRGVVTALSATDACRDRLAAFYHWADRQSLHVAVEIASSQRVDLAKIGRWSKAEGFKVKSEQFRQELRRHRARHRRKQPGAPSTLL